MNRYDCTIVMSEESLNKAMDKMITRFCSDLNIGFDHTWPVKVKVRPNLRTITYEFEVWYDNEISS